MHKYLRSIGFSKYKNRKELRNLLQHVYGESSSSILISEGDDRYGYVNCGFGSGFGLRVLGSYDEDHKFEEEYYFPYVESDVISSTFPCSVERHSDRMAYGGIIEDPIMGISLIFYLTNGIEYLYRQKKQIPTKIKNVSLNALSISGKILLPIEKTEKEKEKLKLATENKQALLEAARKGDEEAIESLALEDMNIFQNVSRRIGKEDIYSIVDTCFMPYGLESDQYSVVGEIHKVEKLTNSLTGEECYRLTMECNHLNMSVMLNAMDLLGEPAVGRRFKGDVWLQGTANFEEA